MHELVARCVRKLSNTILTAMVAILIFRKLNLLCICNVTLIPPSPKLDLRQIEHQSMETARHCICIYHAILIGQGQELNMHLPLQCHSEFATTEN